MTNSDFVEWYDQLIGPGSEMYPHIEHHIYFTSDDTFEVLSEYEPRIIVSELSEQEKEDSDKDENR
ncbi:hypothetical protein [Lentibacillus sp. Marseille-P4043]|uniref:hypothetical protein n=1 Tax=Lentibacillus sp. Marseille-P4043 TaxID=2040293 RepID=UPI000D0BE9D0|nr:hypothetical protein [Lentibacillus sp. Marseille-P4043]